MFICFFNFLFCLVNEPFDFERKYYLDTQVGVRNIEYLKKLKELYDPNSLLNAQFNFKKQGFIKEIKSKDKVKNYILNKLKI